MTALNGRSKLFATAIAAVLLVAGCGGASEQTDEPPVPAESMDSDSNGSELAGVDLNVRRDPG